MIPIAFKRKNETKNEFTKRYTNLLYDSLPQTSLEDRAKCTDVRDKIIELNQGFFGYVVRNKFLNNNYATYEDKYQGCIARFCECWTWYRFKGANTYRTDVSFSVFFAPRLGEMLERDFNEVKYSLRRTLLLKVGNQIDKYWSKVTYEDLSDPRVKLTPSELSSILGIFGTLYPKNVDDISPYLEAPDHMTKTKDPIDDLSDEFDDIVSLLVREMIHKEKKLTTKDINNMSDMYGLDAKDLKEKVPLAEAQLFEILTRDVNRIEFID